MDFVRFGLLKGTIMTNFWKKMVLELTSQSTTTGLLFGSLAFEEGRRNDEGE